MTEEQKDNFLLIALGVIGGVLMLALLALAVGPLMMRWSAGHSRDTNVHIFWFPPSASRSTY